jgi:RNA polymerase sigma-70 factor (ECF subfamily)
MELWLATASQLENRIRLYRKELLGFLTRRVPVEAEELAQEVWLRVAKVNPKCPDEASFRAYMYTVARRLLIDHHRRRSARIQLVTVEQETLDRNPSKGDSPEGQLRANQILRTVERTLSGMKPEIAQVFRLRMTSGKSFKDIATDQGVGINTALGRMHRATRLISEALTNEGLMAGGAA